MQIDFVHILAIKAKSNQVHTYIGQSTMANKYFLLLVKVFLLLPSLHSQGSDRVCIDPKGDRVSLILLVCLDKKVSISNTLNRAAIFGPSLLSSAVLYKNP